MSARPGAGALAIDLNADVGEGFDDAGVLGCVSSASIACGGHAGDTVTMRSAVGLATSLGVAIGAHPSFPDRTGFGREVTTRDPDAIERLVRAQVEALASVAASQGVRLVHVKPHGALYNLAAVDAAVAQAVARAVRAVDPELAVFGLAGSTPALDAVRAARLRVVPEAFADRGYRDDGTLAPRGTPGGLLVDPAEVAARAVRLVLEGRVRSVEGDDVAVHAETLCLHGDTPGAVVIARAVRHALEAAGIAVEPPSARPR